MTGPDAPHPASARPSDGGSAELLRPRRVTDLPPQGEDLAARGDAAARAALARRLDVPGVKRLSLEARLRPEQDGWRVTGRVRARVTQTCVVTLEPVDQILDEPFSRLYLPDAPDPAAVALDPDEEEDPPEPLGRVIDVAEIAAEALALALDPYPRAEGAAFKNDAEAPEDEDAEDDPRRRPFASLAALRDKLARQDDGEDGR